MKLLPHLTFWSAFSLQIYNQTRNPLNPHHTTINTAKATTINPLPPKPPHNPHHKTLQDPLYPRPHHTHPTINHPLLPINHHPQSPPLSITHHHHNHHDPNLPVYKTISMTKDPRPTTSTTTQDPWPPPWTIPPRWSGRETSKIERGKREK